MSYIMVKCYVLDVFESQNLKNWSPARRALSFTTISMQQSIVNIFFISQATY